MTDEKIMATVKPDGECWQPELEKMPRKQLEELQVKKLIVLRICVRFRLLRSRTCATTIPMDWLVAVWMMPYVFTLPVVLRVTLVSLSILSTISARGLT